MTSYQQVMAAALQHGWYIHSQPDPVTLDVTEIRRKRRRNGRQRTEWLQLTTDPYGRLVWVSWGPQMDGFGGRTLHPRESGKLDRALAWIGAYLYYW